MNDKAYSEIIDEFNLSKTSLEVLVGVISFISIGIIFFLAYLFSQSKSLFKNSVNYFLANCIVIDLLKACFNIPVLIFSLEVISNGIHYNVVNSVEQNIACNLNAFLLIFFDTAQLISFAAVSFERLRMVKLPLLTLNKRIKLTKKLLIASWLISIAFTFVLFIIISIWSQFDNLLAFDNKCFIDFFHIYIYSSNFANQTAYVAELNKIQNLIFDSYNFAITLVCLSMSVAFYIQIYTYLKRHNLEMDAKFHFAEHAKHVNTITSMHAKNDSVKCYNLSGELVLHLDKSIVLEGDACIMPKNKEKAKRRLEAKIAKKTVLIMSSFVSCRILFLFIILFREIISFRSYSFYMQVTFEAFYLIELVLVVVSYMSCFLNPLTCILLTENLRSEASDFLYKFYFYFKNSKTNKIDPSF